MFFENLRGREAYLPLTPAVPREPISNFSDVKKLKQGVGYLKIDARKPLYPH